MSDVIAVMRDGRFEQTGSPSEIYDTPRTSYVAEFVGSANVQSGRVVKVENKVAVLENGSGTMLCRTTLRAVTAEANLTAPNLKRADSERADLSELSDLEEDLKEQNPEFPILPGQERTLAIRSESVRVWREKRSEYALHGTIMEKSFVGGMLRIEVKLDDASTMVISRHGINFHYDVGDTVYLEWDAQDAVFVDVEALPRDARRQDGSPMTVRCAEGEVAEVPARDAGSRMVRP